MWRKAVQLQKTALRESFLEVIRLFFCITVVCGEICCFYGRTQGGILVNLLISVVAGIISQYFCKWLDRWFKGN